VVLLIDFDNQYKTRFPYFKNNIPVDLQCRVFVLDVWSEPEQLKRALGCVGFEKIGEALAMDCYENTTQTWEHELLEHNKSELHRMMAAVKPFLFSLAR